MPSTRKHGASPCLIRPYACRTLLPALLAWIPLANAQDASVYQGRWHDPQRCFGLHYDLHANKDDTELGLRAEPALLVQMFELLGCDFVQTDCKGHPGYTSWFSKTPTASVPPQLKADALQGWREATRRLGLPLHCHYSGIWDIVAAKQHPDWAVIDKAGKPTDRMCPRGPYLEQLMIPQLIELIDRYQVDGFWIDGDIWAVQPCYCERCRAAFREATGIDSPPTDASDKNWIRFMQFVRQSFQEYATRYTRAVHEHKPGVLVCSNWLQTFHDPGPPAVPTDWISGDNAHTFGLDGGRVEARFIATRGKPWDVMIWSFYGELPRTVKPPQMIQQEAAVVLAQGGRVQVYEHPHGVRDGRLVEWRVRRMRQTRDFVKARQEHCIGSTPLPQIAVLHSEHHVFNSPFTDLYWSLDVQPVAGATWAMLENHYDVSVLDEWALLPRLSSFALIVVPERGRLSDAMVEALKTYVRAGGRLLVTGADAFDRFGTEFLGAETGELTGAATYWAPAADGTAEMVSPRWRLTRPTTGESLGALGRSTMPDDKLTEHSAAIVNKVGRGRVAYVPFALFRHFHDQRYPLVRAFAGQVAHALLDKLPIRVTAAPTAVDVVLREKDGRTLIHLINRTSGLPNRPNDATVDEIPFVGPITIEMDLATAPQAVALAYEDGAIQHTYADGVLKIAVDKLHIHAAVVVTP